MLSFSRKCIPYNSRICSTSTITTRTLLYNNNNSHTHGNLFKMCTPLFSSNTRFVKTKVYQQTFPSVKEIEETLETDPTLKEIIPPSLKQYKPPKLPEPPKKSAIPDSFAVVLIGGKQFKVTKGDVIISEKLDAEVGSNILIRKILLVGTKEFTAIGQPLLQSAVVDAIVEEQTRAAKVIVFKKKRRKGYRRTKGHRQYITTLRIGDVRMPLDSIK